MKRNNDVPGHLGDPERCFSSEFGMNMASRTRRIGAVELPRASPRYDCPAMS